VMNLAESDEIITKNPISRVRLPRAEKPDKTALTFEELSALIAASHDAIRPFVLLGALGLRAGEALGVTFAHVGDDLRVRQQVLQPKGGCKLVETLKTPQSRRDIPIPASFREALLGCNQVSGIYVCSDSKGGYLTPNNASRELEIAVTKAGIRRITPHELRHTFISLMENELEAPAAIVACLAGRVYAGPNAGYSHSHRRQLAKWINAFWDKCQPGAVVQSVVQGA
jgi:integrase